MLGRITATIISLAIFTYVAILMGLFFVHTNIASQINEITYNVAESTSTSGILSKDTFLYLQEKADRFSRGTGNDRYFIQLKLEKQIKPGIYDTFFEDSDSIKSKINAGQEEQIKILDLPLDVGDRITIYLEDRTQTIFGRLINSSFLGYAPDKLSDIRIKSMKTAIIANRKNNAVKGYDVIADINTRDYSQSGTGYDSTEIFVATKMNSPGGSTYNSNSYTINDPSDPDYIFPDGEFLMEEDIISDVKTTKYIQQ